MDYNSKVTYNYRSNRFSRKAVDHLFRYISMLTGIVFQYDDIDPAIIKNVSVGHSGGKLMIAKSDNVAGEKYLVIDDDPIEGVLDLITMSTGRERGNTAGESDEIKPGRTMSGLLHELLDYLAWREIIPSRKRTVSIWPDEKRFGAVSTHDIDIAGRSLAGGLKLMFMKWPAGRIGGMLDSLKRVASFRHNPYDCIPEWLEMEERLGIISTYFVFAGQRRHPNDPKYDINSLSSRLKETVQRGHEIALHSGIESRDGGFLLDSKQSLEDCMGEAIRGIRPHYLSADYPAYWRRASEIGFRYSSSLGFDNDIGYYNGIDLPFIPFDMEYDSPVNIVEFPIAIMDCGLIKDGPARSDTLKKTAFDMIDKAEETGSLVVLDWHQRTLYDIDYPGWGKLYFEIVEYLLQKKPYMDSLSGMADLFGPRSGGNS